MKYIKVLLVHVLMIAVFQSAHAQLFKIDLDEKVKKSTLIVEGRVVGQRSFWNEKHTMIFTASTVEVYKLFKGQPPGSTIEIMTIGGRVGDRMIDVSDLLRLEKNEVGIFMCFPNQIKLKSPGTGRVLYDVYSSAQGFLKYNLFSDRATAPFVSYDNIEGKLYNLIQQRTGQAAKVVNSSFNAAAMLKHAGTNQLGAEAPLIASFYPATVNGGSMDDPVNNILTITGTGFEDSPSGVSCVIFKDDNTPDLSPNYIVGYNSPYIISWSDTKIVMRVPGRAGTGTFGVVNSDTLIAYSLNYLNVFYALQSTELDFPDYDTSGVVVAHLMNTNGQGGYSIVYSTSSEGKGINLDTALSKKAFQRALYTWKEQVGANITEAGTTTLQVVNPHDSVNVIMFDNENTGMPPLANGALGVCIGGTNFCDAHLPEQPFYLKKGQRDGFDVVIRNSSLYEGEVSKSAEGPCPPALDETDLETVLLHEFGHGLNLAHVVDTYELGDPPTINTANSAKLMHYGAAPGLPRRSLDISAYKAGLYMMQQQHNDYGTCAYTAEMDPLSYTLIPNDDCPSSFPTATITPGTAVDFDLVHATSNKLTDPQFRVVSCDSSTIDEFVTNNAFYAIKTSSSGSLTMDISNYTTYPAEAADCSVQGVKMALFDVSSCPGGQLYPLPVLCRKFSENGPVADFTGLLGNHNYLLYFDGMRNTRASFTATFDGSVLPVVLADFSGKYFKGENYLYMNITEAVNVKQVMIEKGANSANFRELGILPVASSGLIGKHTYIDQQPFAGYNYYRLKITDNDGKVQYSNIILLTNALKQTFFMHPNPVKDKLSMAISGTPAGNYNVGVFDISGRSVSNRVYSLAEGGQVISVPFNGIAPGMYLIKITDSKGNTLTRQKVVKE